MLDVYLDPSLRVCRDLPPSRRMRVCPIRKTLETKLHEIGILWDSLADVDLDGKVYARVRLYREEQAVMLMMFFGVSDESS